MIYSLLRSIVRIEAGRSCRTCSESISPRDPFGLSEGVCHPCRED